MNIIIAIYNLTLKLFSATHPFLILFLFFGLYRRPLSNNYRRGELYLATYIISYLLLLLLFFVTHHYSSKRYFLPLVVPILIWCGLGFREVSSRLHKIIPSWSVNKWVSILVILALAIMLPKALEPLRGDRALRRQMGLWLRENGVKHPIIITREPRIAFYAQGKAIPLKDYSYPRIIQLARETRAHYLIINTKDLGTGLTKFLQAINPEELVLLPGKMQARREEGGDKWLIYQFKELD